MGDILFPLPASKIRGEGDGGKGGGEENKSSITKQEEEGGPFSSSLRLSRIRNATPLERGWK